VKPANFDPRKAQDDLYNWNSVRSEYLAQDNNEISGQYAGAGYDPGWYWDPYALDYTFIGAGSFWSPFGWGFYPFGWGGGWWGGGYYGGGYYGGGYYGGNGYHRYGNNVAGIGNRPIGGPIHGSGFHSMGGFHSGGGFHSSGFSGGGFHGGGGFGAWRLPRRRWRWLWWRWSSIIHWRELTLRAGGRSPAHSILATRGNEPMSFIH